MNLGGGLHRYFFLFLVLLKNYSLQEFFQRLSYYSTLDEDLAHVQVFSYHVDRWPHNSKALPEHFKLHLANLLQAEGPP